VISAVHPMIARADDGTPSAPPAPASGDTSSAVGSTQPSSPAADDTQAPAANPTQAPAATEPSVAPASTQAPPAASTPAPTEAAPVTTEAAQAPAETDTSVAPTDVAPADTTAASTPVPTEAASTEAPATILPTDTPVVVLDATGTPVPLATQAAADIIQTGDPIWCPNGVAPIAGQGGCTGSYSNLLSLAKSEELASVEGHDGTIWIEQGTDTSLASILINGIYLSNLQNFTLTLQGGWDGTSDGLTGGSGTTEFNGHSVNIMNWGNDVTVNDLYIHDDTPLINSGLTVKTTGNINVHNVRSNHNEVDGADLDNSSGSGSIFVDHSTFDENGNDGLVAYSNGDITLTGVTADNNTDAGAELNNVADPPSVSITNSDFNENGEDGLIIFTEGDTTLTGVTANDNDGTGALLKTGGNITVNNSDFSTNGFDGFDAGTFAGDITATHSDFSTNGSNGLSAFALNGGISLTGITANDNVDDGAFLIDSGDLSVSDSTASGNGNDGIFISQGIDPTDTITCSVANNNGGYGVNANLAEGTTLTLNGVTLSGNASGLSNVSGGALIAASVNCGSGHGKSGTGSLPVNTINVVSGGSNTLDCTNFSSTDLVLPNGDHALLPCPNGKSGTVTSQTGSNLPGALDSKYSFVSGFNAEVSPSLSGSMTVSFMIPSGKQGANFAILYWDGTKWVSLGGSENPIGFFSVQTNLTGNFVLVTQ